MRSRNWLLPLVAPWLAACPAPAPTARVEPPSASDASGAVDPIVAHPGTSTPTDSATATTGETGATVETLTLDEIGLESTGFLAGLAAGQPPPPVDADNDHDASIDLPVKGGWDAPPTKGTGDQVKIGRLSGLGTGLQREDVLQILRRQHGHLRSCWNRLLLAVPEQADGHVSVRFTVEPAGTVTGTEIAASTITDPAFLDCVRSVVKELRFPTTDAPTIVTYPFRFTLPTPGE